MTLIQFPSFEMLAAFMSVSFLLAIVPGPAVLFILTRVLSEGRLAGVASVLGVALGNLCNVIGSTLGLSVLFAMSSFAFFTVKYAGALYLFYLGVVALRSKPRSDITLSKHRTPIKKIFRDGFFVALFNPKTALFFAAFLPQFVTHTASFGFQSFILGCVFVIIAAATDVCYVFVASSIYPVISRRGNKYTSVGRFITAFSFFFLAVFAAFSDVHSH